MQVGGAAAAPQWLTQGGPQHTARPPQSTGGQGQAETLGACCVTAQKARCTLLAKLESPHFSDKQTETRESGGLGLAANSKL